MGDEATSLLRGIRTTQGETHQSLPKRPALVIIQHPDAEPVRVPRRDRVRDRDDPAHPGERAVHGDVLLVRDQPAHLAVLLHRAGDRVE